MRTLLVAIGIAVLALAAAPRDAAADGHGHGHWRHGHWHGGTRVVVGVGPGWWWRPGFYAAVPLYGYPPYPPPPYPPYPPPYPYGAYQGPPRGEEPPVYVERDQPSGYDSNWYYCEPRHAYYPDVDTCPEDWIPVPPRD